MEQIYITGHRNPDTDSICASWCYADLKNKIDPDNQYIPIRCGGLNTQSRALFERLGLNPPAMKKDLHPRVSDISRRDIISLDINDPVFKAIQELDSRTISVVAVFEEGHIFKGLVTTHEISSYFISEITGERPIYDFRCSNFEQVVPGYFYRRGDQTGFQASIMTGALPFEISVKRTTDLSLKPLLVIGLREDLIEYAVKEDFPAIIITGMGKQETIPVDLSQYKGTVYISRVDTAETIRLLRLSAPVYNILSKNLSSLQSSELFETARKRLVDSALRGLPVFDNDRFDGVVSRRCFIEKPSKKVILVDHNEMDQSIEGIEDAEITEIIDHHRLATRTLKPLYVHVRPVGSSCTLIYDHYKMRNVVVPKDCAKLLLAGILSDTVILKSPTTTPFDTQAVLELEKIAGVQAITFGEELFSHSPSLKDINPVHAINSDFKIYTENRIKVGIGQIEITNFQGLENVESTFIEQLAKISKEKKLNWVMVLISNVLKSQSILIVSSLPEGEYLLPFKKLREGVYDLPGVLSRKKQLLPEILHIAGELKLANSRFP